MNNEELIKENQILKEELEKTKNILNETQEHLKKYTAPIRNKTYYENHKQELLEKMKTNPIPSDKRKEYNKKYYLKKKDRMNSLKENNEEPKNETI